MALAVVMTVGAMAAPAFADALAVSDILLSNLLFTNGTRTLAATDFTALTFTNSAQVTATLNGASATNSCPGGVGCAPTPSPIDLYACAPGSVGCPANNTYPFTGPPAVTSFALADQNESGAPITGITGVSTPATVNAGSYASIVGGGAGNSTSQNGLSSTFIFTLASATAVTINFNAQEYLDAWTAAGQIFPTNALSSTTVCFTVTPVGGTTPIINWCPDGSSTPGTGADLGITASTEPFSLNQNASRNAPFNGNTQFGPSTGSFSGTTIVLAAGTAYQLSAVETATATALEVVSEPGSLMLLGAGLLGLGTTFTLRRRKKSE